MTDDLPKYNELLYPTLQAIQGLGGEAFNDEIENAVIDLLDLPEEALELRYEESEDWIIKNRITFAKSYAKKANLLANPKKSFWALTETADELLQLPREEGEIKALELSAIASKEFKEESKARKLKKNNEKSRYGNYRKVLEFLGDQTEPIHSKSIINQLSNKPTKSEGDADIHFALQYLYDGRALSRPKPATYQITDFGKSLLEMDEDQIIALVDVEGSQLYLPGGERNREAGFVLSLGEELLFDPAEFFVEVEELLEDRPQAIFYGPPGTGKTFAALQLAEVLAGDESRTKLVQFHPSYAYEDFIEGWRPTEDGSFRITDGPLKRMAADAAANPDDTFVLVIDEINRANLSKVLGELFFLLEYRDRSITLQYSDIEFQLPENLKIIGTMNTADRSIALVDAALRRRFHFHGFFPDREPIQGLLRRWLDAQGKTDLLWVADLIDAANNKLDERDLAIGPSHFMKADLDEDKVQMVWKRSIMPYIEDHYFDDPDQATEFTYDQLRNNTQP